MSKNLNPKTNLPEDEIINPLDLDIEIIKLFKELKIWNKVKDNWEWNIKFRKKGKLSQIFTFNFEIRKTKYIVRKFPYEFEIRKQVSVKKIVDKLTTVIQRDL